MDPFEKALKEKALELLVGTTHPWLIEELLDLMDSNPDVRTKLAMEYEQEWPERAEKFFYLRECKEEFIHLRESYAVLNEVFNDES